MLVFVLICSFLNSSNLLFDPSNITGAVDAKMDGSVLEKKSSFKTLGILSFSSK